MRAALLVLPSCLALAAPAGAQEAAQSVLRAAGDPGHALLQLGWILFIGAGLIFVFVLAVLGLALAGPAHWRERIGRRGWIVGAGIVFPVVVLTVLLVHTLGLAGGLVRARAEPAAVRIQVTGELWWWRVRHLAADGEVLLETANEIRIPVGRPVELLLESHDVIHSFWVPALAGKLDLIPGTTNRLRLRATEAGTFLGKCAEFCGLQHAKMALLVVAEPPQQHAAWVEAQRAPAAAPGQPLAQQGAALFAKARCGACHAIRGTPAAGRLGPDLTHVGSRLALAAATLPNGPQALAAWISDPQHVKPGSRMPAYRGFRPEELQALVRYLEELR